MCDILRAAGVTHVSFGNHEADFGLATLRDRIKELSKSIMTINTNMRRPPLDASWLTQMTQPHSLIHSHCGRVKIGLLGLLGEGDNMFRDGTFRGVPIDPVTTEFEKQYEKLVPTRVADFLIPMSHQSLESDRILAETMNKTMGPGGIIFGGHEHDLIDETTGGDVRIVKTGSNAEHASLVDLKFDISVESPQLVDLDVSFVDLTLLKDSFVLKKIVDKHMAGIRKMEEEIIVDDSVYCRPSAMICLLEKLSSKRARYAQTTAGAFFCQAIKQELEVDVAIINGASIKGDTTYENNNMSYSQLKNELPFPTKMVVVSMTRTELVEAIKYSRTNIPSSSKAGTSTSSDTTASDAASQVDDIERKGYLQVDFEFNFEGGKQDELLQVALPRNLLSGFCKIKPLMKVGDRLKKYNMFPSDDDFIPALDLVTRFCCHARWASIIGDHFSFEEADLNNDGLLDREEIKILMEKFLGHEPSDFVVDDMIQSIDEDGNGVIDIDEFSHVLAKMERSV